MADEDKLLVVPLGAESKAITQTISNDTAMSILELLADAPMSTSAIAKKLNIPLTTAQYNIEKLIDAGLAKVEKTKYSEKGREVKLYAPAKRFIVLVPEKTASQAVMDALKKYMVLLPVAAVLAVLVEYLVPLKNMLMGTSHDGAVDMTGRAGGASEDVFYTVKNAPEALPALAPVEPQSITDQITGSIASMDILSHSGVWFLMGCLLILAAIVFIEYFKYSNIGKSLLKK